MQEQRRSSNFSEQKAGRQTWCKVTGGIGGPRGIHTSPGYAMAMAYYKLRCFLKTITRPGKLLHFGDAGKPKAIGHQNHCCHGCYVYHSQIVLVVVYGIGSPTLLYIFDPSEAYCNGFDQQWCQPGWSTPRAVGLRGTVLVGDDHSFRGHPLIEQGLLFRGWHYQVTLWSNVGD